VSKIDQFDMEGKARFSFNYGQISLMSVNNQNIYNVLLTMGDV